MPGSTGNGRPSATGSHRLDGRIAVNAGFLVGHSALRLAAMGDDAVGGDATPEQIEQMVALLHDALDDGALGLSTSQSTDPQRRRRPAGAVAQRIARGAGGAGGRRPRPPGHHARGDHPRLPLGLHRRRDRAAHRHVAGRRPAAELERARRLGGEPRRARKAAARIGSRRRTRRPGRRAHAAAGHEDPAVVPVRLRARRAAGLARDDAPAGARAAAARSPIPRCAAASTRAPHSKEAGMLRGLAQLGAADHRRDVRPRERRRDRPQRRRGRRRARWRAVRHAARHRDRRRAAYRALAARRSATTKPTGRCAPRCGATRMR